tara:strand:+ start:5257 stop:5898 length:642 start_codon:yes stop_codon:yes gene_type:complete
MKESLNAIVENLAFSLGDQHNMTLREALKHTVSLYREKLLREEDFQSSLNYNDFTQNIILPLEDWNHPLCGDGKITVDKIPSSIRFKTRGRVNYYFLGDSIFTNAYMQTTFAEYQFVKHLKHQTNKYYYIIEDGKVIVLDAIKLCDIGVKGVFADPNLLKNVCDNVNQLDDDAPYPLGGDLLTIIRKGILSGDFPVRQLGEKDVVTSDSDNEQ